MNTRAEVVEFLRFVREHSPFYRNFYKTVPVDAALDDYPILDSQAFWAANSIANNQVFTAPLTEGVTFKSGGTTGQPKYSVFSNSDWRAFTNAFGQGMRRAGLKAGDRIGNVFYAGRLYASFLFIGRSIEAAGVGICYPLGGDDLDEILMAWRQFDLGILAGVPTSIMKILERLTPEDRGRLRLETILYGGEPMFADQIAAVQAIFPGCQVRSIGIAGVDYGELGWVSPGAAPGVHHVFDESSVMELVDDDGQPIHHSGQPGRILVTNLKRRLMPIVRYPVGDRGEWIDPEATPARRFRLLGRAEEGARIGPVTLYIEDMRQLLQGQSIAGMQDFQLVISHQDQRDACLLRIALAVPATGSDALAGQVIKQIYEERPLYQSSVAKRLIHPLRIEWIGLGELHTNPRTGKLLRVVDLRHD